MVGTVPSFFPPLSSVCLWQHLAEECGSWGASGVRRGERLETAPSAQKGGGWWGWTFANMERAEKQNSPALWYSEKGSVLGLKRTSYRISSKERLRGVWRSGFIVCCSERLGVDSRVQMRIKGVAIPFVGGAGKWVWGAFWPDSRHCPTPDPEAQAPSPFEAEIMEVKQRTFLFHTRQTQCLKHHGTDPAGHHWCFIFVSKNAIWAISWA